MPNAEHNGLDDPGPEHQGAADKRDRTEPDRQTAGDKDEPMTTNAAAMIQKNRAYLIVTSLSSPARVSPRS